jgi:hypothetical protein
MIYAGATHDFLGNLLPDKDFRAEIFSLVDAAWPRVQLLDDLWLEPRITGLLQQALVAEQEFRHGDAGPFFIIEDVKKRNPKTGKEDGRSDLEFHLLSQRIRGQKPNLVFEAKRLDITRVGVCDPNVHEYVGDEGMGCLIEGSYDSLPNQSGILAYVMDGNLATAKRSVEKQLANKSIELRLRGDAKVHPSEFMPKRGSHGETHHTTGSQPSVLFHMFLPVTQSPNRKS